MQRLKVLLLSLIAAVMLAGVVPVADAQVVVVRPRHRRYYHRPYHRYHRRYYTRHPNRR